MARAPKNIPAAAALSPDVVTAQIRAAVDDAVMADRIRIWSIMETDAAKARPALAAELAIMQGMSAENALTILGKVPAEDPTFAAINRQADAFTALMAQVGSTGIPFEPTAPAAAARAGELSPERAEQIAHFAKKASGLPFNPGF
ncbi:hypothetical protein E8L99_16535 [Phreatobacter aquaticus]|uniref:Uncharacterized protein n=1 Tax=Phreatobacter aquaticus TaxID=2570229 RepID=A0A4D7QNR4_9HYPH|nr:hypothetical protein [Phreatobacter aquaticus]QCK87249.1 hypothetical protein E8L99_16535 [Phreatobacter aquaticus]